MIFHFFPSHSAYAEVRGRLAGVSPFLSSCRSWGLNPGHQAWHQVPLPTESSHSPLFVFKVNNVSYSGSTLSNANLILPSCSLQRWQRQVDLLGAFIVWDCGAGVVVEWQIRTGLKEITSKRCTHVHAECGH